MMRLDHIAIRCKDREKTSNFLIKAFGYEIQSDFVIDFPNGTKAKCYALQPVKKIDNVVMPWVLPHVVGDVHVEYHLPPEVFVSEGDADSIVGKWVAKRDGIGGIHHIAYQVDSVKETMNEWREKGYAEFTSDNPMTCPEDNLVQIFTKPSELTGFIYEFIERGEKGFCGKNVLDLMESTKNFK
jgi:catechol 2,3-dioxygenase-like lactoylglutathione lyase family enzyme